MPGCAAARVGRRAPDRTHVGKSNGIAAQGRRATHGAANPYFLQTGILAAGPEGIDSKRDPGLLDALRRTEKNAELKHYFGESFINSYITRHLPEWERQNMLDC